MPLRTANLTALERSSGVTRETLTKMRDFGMARTDKIAAVARSLGIGDEIVTAEHRHRSETRIVSDNAELASTERSLASSSGQPVPLVHREYARLRSTLTTEQVRDAAKYEAEIYLDLERYVGDPEERQEQAWLSTVRYIKERYLQNEDDDV